MKTKAIRIRRPGGAEALRWEDVELARPGPGEALIKTAAAGLNYIDIYQRSGLYPIPLPATLGLEGAGVVEEVGDGVADLRPGDRVGYCVAGLGAYSQYRLAPARRLIKLPDDISCELAAAMLLKGMTAEYLIRRLYPARAGEYALFHAAAGGVGLIACQWLAKIGAVVIGTAGGAEKTALAKAHGCAYVIDYKTEDIAARVRDITGGRGVAVAYDSVGKDTFAATLDSLAPRGMFVSFGNASGPVESISPPQLAQKGSLFFTRPTLMHYTADDGEMRQSAAALFAAHRDGVSVEIKQRFALQDAARAHRALESRATAGSTILLP